VKEQLKNVNYQKDKIKSEFEMYEKESVEEYNELYVEKIKPMLYSVTLFIIQFPPLSNFFV
jgi:uncharacterized membrane protein (DUF106 family)